MWFSILILKVWVADSLTLNMNFINQLNYLVCLSACTRPQNTHQTPTTLTIIGGLTRGWICTPHCLCQAYFSAFPSCSQPGFPVKTTRKVCKVLPCLNISEFSYPNVVLPTTGVMPHMTPSFSVVSIKILPPLHGSM